MNKFGRLFFLYSCFVTWVLAIIVEGCGRSELGLELELIDGSVLVDGATRDGNVLSDGRVLDGSPGRDAPNDITVPPDARRDGPPVTDAITESGVNCSPLAACANVCINLNTDPNNCGGCGNRCPASTPSCLNGTCVLTCTTDSGPMLTNCSNACANLQTDSMHCGSCSNACTQGEQCTNGACGCPMGQMLCNGQCVNVQSDLTNCGACGNNCASMPVPAGATAWVCSGGTCSTMCMSATPTRCPNGSCVDLTNDNANCGACGNVCGGGSTCMNSVCTCPRGQAYCNGACIPDQSDPNNCGACGHVCGTGTTCTGGACVCAGGLAHCGNGCVDTATDNSNCGSCGVRCGAGTTCQNGSCQCYNGIRCNGICTPTQSDPNNCGACGNVCPAGTPVCNTGVCTVNCTTDSGATLANCSNACVNTQTDPNNCGTCAHQCPNGGSCVGGMCQCSSSDILCGITCVDPTSNNANCGRCGNACRGGTTCSDSMCAAGCGDGGLTMCTAMGRGGVMMSTCVDTLTSATNCGSCGTFCPFGGSCTDGTCGCAAGLTQCSFGMRMGLGNCVDTTANNANCGSCGNRCGGSTPLCSESTCVVRCVPPTTQCTGGGGIFGGGGNVCANLSHNKSNCGFCGVNCTGNLLCTNGSCSCSSPYTDCGGTCTNLQTDNNNCGTCGTACVSPNICKGGVCGN
jgi:hypothetical protein